MTSSKLHRRAALRLGIGAAAVASMPLLASASEPSRFHLATISADITPPLGHPLIGGLRPPAKAIGDPLLARGVALLGDEKPVLIISLDWCELRNDAYDELRDVLAEAAKTTRERVILTSNHQHDAPYLDLTAQKLLDEAGFRNAMFLPEFWQETKERLAEAVRLSLTKTTAVTHLGLGEATVRGVACNRRVVAADGKPKFNRYSFTADKFLIEAPDGVIDPQVRTIGFFENERPLAAVNVYATHPMSYYGRGEVSGDFPGLARQLWEREHPEIMNVYVTGCSGDVVAAKYNDGTPAGRARLAQSLKDAMNEAWKALRRVPLTKIAFRREALEIPPPTDGKLDPKKLAETIANKDAPAAQRIDAACGLSYYRRCERGQPIDVPLVDFGVAAYLALPAEMFVGYSLNAQDVNRKRHPDRLLLVAGFSECAPGYIPTASAREEGFVQEHSYCWVRADAAPKIERAIGKILD